MEDLKEFMPKSREVLVGTDTMVVKTLSAVKRDAVARVLLRNLDVAKLVKPIMDNIRQTRELSARVAEAIEKKDLEAARRLRDEAAGASLDIAGIIAQVKDIVQSLLTGDMTQVSCIILDVLDNRQRAKANGELKADGEGYEFSEQMFAHVRENLTPTQEFQVFKAAVEVNDLLGLAKNYWTLVASKMMAGEAETEETEETTG